MPQWGSHWFLEQVKIKLKHKYGSGDAAEMNRHRLAEAIFLLNFGAAFFQRVFVP